MKISNLQQLKILAPDIDIPIAIAGQTMRVKLHQILSLLQTSVVPFDSVVSNPLSEITYAQGSTGINTKTIFDSHTNKFYASYGVFNVVGNGQIVAQWYYYSDWDLKSLFYDEDGNIRTDCLYLGSNGALYRFNGTTLISAGITDEILRQIALNTPIRVSDEDEMNRMIENGEIVEGQKYYIPEE